MKTLVVAIVQTRLLHYRCELFERMQTLLSARGIRLRLIHGQASPQDATRKDEGTLEWSESIKNRYLRLLGKDLTWQELPEDMDASDLVVLMQENKILSNYPVLSMRRWKGRPVAFWGHGRNFQSTNPSGIRETWKRFVLRRVDWWFTYTDLCVDHLVDSGFPVQRITSLENAIDVTGFKATIRDVSQSDISQWKRELDIADNASIGLFCGSMYAEKKIDLLIESAYRVRKEVANFALIVVGDGPEAHKFEIAAAEHSWIKRVGRRVGKDKAMFYRMADVVLNPGAVGLHVLDAFVSGAPMITTRRALHGPEIAYLRDGHNGVICESDDATSYATAVVEVLNNQDYRAALASAGLADGEHYTIENMARRFVDGIVACLDLPESRRHRTDGELR